MAATAWALLGLHRQHVDRALARLLELGLVAHRPWRPGHPDGVWQFLPVAVAKPRTGGDPAAIADVLAQFKLRRQDDR
jgi:hypothetical protein